MTATAKRIEVVTESGVEIDVPLNKLKKSPKNARKVPHGEAAIEALAASIGAKRMLQPLIVEPEFVGGGEPTGFYLVTIGEGRRLAQLLRAKRGDIKKTHPIRCVVEVSLDGQEISLDENITRTAMHPADQFEAFRDQAERRGFGPEEIAARFGVSPQLVRQRLRLGAVSPRLMAVYREDGLTLDQLMAFAVSEDHARHELMVHAAQRKARRLDIDGQKDGVGIGADHLREEVYLGDADALTAGFKIGVGPGGDAHGLGDLGDLEATPAADRLEDWGQERRVEIRFSGRSRSHLIRVRFNLHLSRLSTAPSGGSSLTSGCGRQWSPPGCARELV
jgi:ParB-like chromosome segregation protein Spo0J